MPQPELAERLRAGDRAAIAAALNLIEDSRPERREEALTLLRELERGAGDALRVGITGAPGAGKSTLVDALVRSLRAHDRTIGIIAVDPSSQRSGGALLGDRVRMRSGAVDPGVFMRSMAARSHLGGLAEATRAGIEILAAAFDVVFVETVGVGQSEAEVVNLVDTLVFVAQPGAGDSIQFMKAGILEMPDIFVVNKADLGPQAERTCNELHSSLGLAEAADDGWQKPALLASARDAKGIDEVVDAIDGHRRHLEAKGLLVERRRLGRDANLLATLEHRYGSYGIEAAGGSPALRDRVRALSQDVSLYDAIRDLGSQIETALARKR